MKWVLLILHRHKQEMISVSMQTAYLLHLLHLRYFVLISVPLHSRSVQSFFPYKYGYLLKITVYSIKDLLSNPKAVFTIISTFSLKRIFLNYIYFPNIHQSTMLFPYLYIATIKNGKCPITCSINGTSPIICFLIF